MLQVAISVSQQARLQQARLHSNLLAACIARMLQLAVCRSMRPPSYTRTLRHSFYPIYPYNMDWSGILDHAARRFDGGDVSFTSACILATTRQLGYECPNRDYTKLFRQRPCTPETTAGERPVRRLRSAG